MHWAGWTAIALVVGTAAGVGAGKLGAASKDPGAPPVLPGVEVAAPAEHTAPLFADATPATAAAAATPTESATATAQPAAPVAAALGKVPSEILVLPHGPGHFASVDLAAAGLSALPVYAGTMVRDGPAQLTTIQRAAKVASLKGPEAEFEWLHAGFDRDARLVAAHIRLPEGGAEGIIVLTVNRKGQPEALLPIRPKAIRHAEPPAPAVAPKAP